MRNFLIIIIFFKLKNNMIDQKSDNSSNYNFGSKKYTIEIRSNMHAVSKLSDDLNFY